MSFQCGPWPHGPRHTLSSTQGEGRDEAEAKDAHQLYRKEGSGNLPVSSTATEVHGKPAREAGKVSPYAGGVGAQLKFY